MTAPLDERLFEQLSTICLRLPEATCERRGGRHAQFLVRGKKFVYFLVDHHGDGRLGLCFRAAPGENVAMAAAEPERFYLPAYIGPRGWGALRLDVGEVDWDEVIELVMDSYRYAAPKKLALASATAAVLRDPSLPALP